MNEDELYEAFAERCGETGQCEIPPEWPRSLRKRCLFLLRLLRDGSEPRAGTRSLLGGLEALGIPADGPALDAAAPGALPSLARDAERYVVERELARGGMGQIFLAYDRDFRRRVAMKVMMGTIDDRQRASRFIQEAQTTAQLDHPHIAPVHDIGIHPGGSPFFTMKWIRGRDLAGLLASGDSQLTLTRLIQILQQVAMGIHFAHSKGVVHRDLKPQNIMVGDFGEVLIVDWGLARVLRPGADGAATEVAAVEPVSTERADGPLHTADGAVQGSIAYMAPEQARGETRAIDARTDVFGLGAILYEILTGEAPHAAPTAHSALARARQGRIVPPRERVPGREIPRPLEEICLKALAPRQEDRYRDAGELHHALQAYLEGIHVAERQALEAGRLHWIAEKLLRELREAEARESELRTEAAAARAELQPHDPESRKRRLWDLSEQHERAQEATAAELTRTTAAYLGVLSIQPSHAEARSRLAGLFYERLTAAEERGDREGAALYRGLVAQYDDGRYHRELEGQGLLRLASDPPGATVLLTRFEERGVVFREGSWETLGTTPLERPLPQGSYLAILWKEGLAEARYPFVIGRGGPHEGVVRLVTAGSIPEGFVQVPGGLTIVGSDEKDYPSLPRQRVLVADVFVGRFPVTFAEYCAFLDDTQDAAAPPPELQAVFGKEEYILRTPAGFAPIPRLDPRLPVIAVTRAATQAYCAWLGRKLHRPVRLLTELEWERCARGADGRLYPWGNGFDWALAKGALSGPGEPAPDAVGKFPRDVSVFGVQDLAGTVRELCDGWIREGYRPLRGGSWYNPFPFVFRADFRTMQRDGNRSTDAGFRVGYDRRGLADPAAGI